jgi:hypothetical protein
MTLIGQCHTMLHTNGILRIQSDIRVGSRTDKKQSFEDKVKAVERLLAEDDQVIEAAEGAAEDGDEKMA